jgi:hypothetical protein
MPLRNQGLWQRFGRALRNTSVDLGHILDPCSLLVSEATDGNEVLYRLKASVQWCHVPIREFNNCWNLVSVVTEYCCPSYS